MFLFFDDEKSKKDNNRKPEGMAVTHVDDVLHAGTKHFDEKVMNPLKDSFKFGNEEECEFRYVGLNMKQSNSGITVNQNHYVENLAEPDVSRLKDLKGSDVLKEEDQTEFSSAVAKLATIAYTSRPDLCFNVKSLSSKYGKATKSDLKAVQRKIVLLKAEGCTELKYQKMGDIEDWILVGFGDAGIKSMPDKMTSVNGSVLLLCNRKTGAAAVLNWRSKKLRRKVTSSMAGECYSLVAIIGEMVYTKGVLAQIYGQRIQNIPCLAVTDCKNLYEAVHSTSLVEDMWLITDIAAIKEAIETGEVTEIQRVPSERMLANCLTKNGASGEELLKVMRSGRYTLPPGWLQNWDKKI